METYNNTYRSVIKCTPTETRKILNEEFLRRNVSKCLYAKKFKRKYRDLY